MSLDLDKLLDEYKEEYGDDQKLAFTDCVINTVTGDTIFASMAVLDSDNYIISIPLILRNMDETDIGENFVESKISFIEYCPFTTDKFTLIQRKDIITINVLSEQSRDIYLKAVRKIYEGEMEDSDHQNDETEDEFSSVDDDEQTIIIH